ncbi:MAG: hypothetical protein H0U92_04590 [Actinobacteria bacterium]|nr:hypothetical protein [Actinomycetota bacterium]
MLRRALVTALLALTISATLTAPTQAAAASPLDAVKTLLTARAKAEVASDRAAFADTIDPQAPAAFRDAQLKSFDGLTSLPVQSLSYDVRVDLIGDLTRAVSRSEYGGATVYLPQTIRALQFTLDADAPGLDDMWWTYVQRDGKWYVGGNDDVTDLGLEPTESMWDLAPVVTLQTPHVMLIVHPENRDRGQALAASAENALRTIAQRWTLPWPGRLVGFVPSSPDELATIIQATIDVKKFVAFISYAFDPESLRATVPRLYVQDTNLSRYGTAQQTETLVHEFVHAAGAAYTGPYTPAWAQEGLADWIATGLPKPEAPTPQLNDTPPRNDQFGAGSQTDIVRAYRDSKSLVAELAVLKGKAAPFDFFKAMGADIVRPGNSDYVVDKSLAVLGLTTGELIGALRRG